MPSYLGGSASIHLITAELDKTITANPWNHVGPEPTAHLNKIAKVFTDETVRGRLKEIVILSQDEIPTGLRFIGPQQDMPFFLVNANRGQTNEPKEPNVSHQSVSSTAGTRYSQRSQARSAKEGCTDEEQPVSTRTDSRVKSLQLNTR